MCKKGAFYFLPPTFHCFYKVFYFVAVLALSLKLLFSSSLLSLSLSLSLSHITHSQHVRPSLFFIREETTAVVSIERKRHTTGVVTAQYRARCSTYTVNKEYCSTFLLQNFTFNSLLCLCNALWNYYPISSPFFFQCGWYSKYINWGKNSLLT